MMPDTVRAVTGHARRGGPMTRVLSFIMPSQGDRSCLRPTAGVHHNELPSVS
jgi:hypothetical protein